MSNKNIERFEPFLLEDRLEHPIAVMANHSNGEYVRYSEYECIVKELEARPSVADAISEVEKMLEGTGPLWHHADEPMPRDEEILVIHGEWFTFSIGYAQELETVSQIRAWCTRKDLILSARINEILSRLRSLSPGVAERNGG
jgi:hypothetical protein